MDSNVQVIGLFIKSTIRKNPFAYFKYALILIPIFSIVSMFATATTLPAINQRIFFNKSTYESIVLFDDKQSDTYICDGGILSQNENSNYYLANVLISENIDDIARITDNNIYRTSRIIKTGGSKIGISYNIAANIGVSIGDSVNVLVAQNDGSSLKIDGIVYQIYNSFYFNLQENEYDEGYGLCIIYPGSGIDVSGLNGRYICAGDRGESSNFVSRESQIKKISSDFSLAIFTRAVIPVLAVILLGVINYSNISYMIKQQRRNMGLFIVLGTAPSWLFRGLFMNIMIVNTIAVALSVLTYKFLLFDIWLKQIVPSGVTCLVLLILILVCVLCTHISIQIQRARFNASTILKTLFERLY